MYRCQPRSLTREQSPTHSTVLVKRDDNLASEKSTQNSRELTVDIKIVHLDADSAVSDHPAVMRCSLPPHEPLAFDSFDAYDVHYQKTHTNRCSECQRNFPDEHFLHLHIAENHDPITAAKREKGEKMYACLVPDCHRPCSTPQKRRLHCIDKHQFPRNYDFFIVNDGIDRRSSMLRPPHRRRSSAFSSMGDASTRRRGESFASTVGVGMDLVQDEYEHHDGQTVNLGAVNGESRRIPVKLRGRGGFGHPRGRGRGDVSTAQETSKAPHASSSSSQDPVQELASSMSALHFVPHSVQMAQGRGRATGRRGG
ncbi:hypothetical protein BDU57DRAFT_295420 [Ampelomyces quisqualis]|uniref:C2H2-type domain-containing protein n=1 Tax=Ampelomyces quisqualis TaxID=50730 RepID=A0A6A5QFK6_AMPQU|nr:hypothetical protein BDU57DRAFT_295420 [Ampelomyces quisqualis]